MNTLRFAVLIVAAVSSIFQLINFLLGMYYPTKFSIGFSMLTTIILLLTWAKDSFKGAEIK